MKKILILCCTILTLCSAQSQAPNQCALQLLSDNFNNPGLWTTWGTATSISGGTFNFSNTTGDHYDRKFRAVTNLNTYSNTIFARCKVFVNSGNAPNHHIFTLSENGNLDPVSYDATSSPAYAATVNDAIIVDLTAQHSPATSTSDPNPTNPNNLWQFNLRYKKGTALFTCPSAINLPALGTWYYVQLERGGNTLKLSVFSNPAHTIHIPGSPICFTINSTLDPLGFVNLGVYTGASQYSSLTGKIDALTICAGSDVVNCSPPCDTSCHLNLDIRGITGGTFACGKTINLKCNNPYNFNPWFTCSSSAVISATLTDASNNTPFWATGFLANNGAGILSVPGGISPGIYTLTYTYGVNGKICGTCKFKLNIKCKPCNCTLIDTITINGVNTGLKCGDTVSLQCKTKYKFKRRLKCINGDTLTQITAVSVHDASNNTPAWANTFITNLGNGVLNIPNNVSGIFSVTYYWGSNGNICDSCTYYLNITCCKCSFSLGFEGSYISSIFHCGDTIKAKCGYYALFEPSLVCEDKTQLIGFSLTDAANHTPSWAAGFNGTGNILVPAGVSGIFTLTYTWGGADGTPCGSCKIFLDINCDDCKCTFSTTYQLLPKGKIINLDCGSITNASCNYTYNITPTLTCNGNSPTHITSVTFQDAANNTPSWAATFLSNSGSGPLSIPNGVSGYYALTYTWGFGKITCNSCTYYISVSCANCECKDNLVRNGVFQNIPTGLGSDISNTQSNDWFATSQSPQYNPAIGYCDSGYVLMWGNKYVGEQITQTNVNIQANHKYSISFSGKFGGSVIANNVAFRFTASNSVPGGYGAAITGGVQMGLSSPISTASFAPYTLPVWTAPSNYSTISINAENGYINNDGDYVSWGHIDNLCITDVTTPCDLLTVDAGPDIDMCSNNPAQLSTYISGGTAPFIYSWSPSNGLSSTIIPNPTCNLVGTYVITVKDATGCVKSDIVKTYMGGVCTPGFQKQTNLVTANKLKSLKIIPNPFTNEFKIDGLHGGEIALNIYTGDGKLVAEYSNLTNGQSFGRGLTAGIYLIKIFHKDGSFITKKVIKN